MFLLMRPVRGCTREDAFAERARESLGNCNTDEMRDTHEYNLVYIASDR